MNKASIHLVTAATMQREYVRLGENLQAIQNPNGTAECTKALKEAKDRAERIAEKLATLLKAE